MAQVFNLNAWQGKLDRDHKQAVKKSMTNLMIYLENVEGLGSRLRFNELSQEIEWNGKLFDETSDQIAIRMMLEDLNYEPAKGDLYPAIIAYAKTNSYHPVRDYLDKLNWDKISRIDTWLTTFLDADDTPFNRLAGRKTLISAVARAFDPGCKVDTMLILEGDQGVKKSSAIETLFGSDFYTASVSLFRDHKQMVMGMMGAWVIELPEFTAVLKSDPEHVKGLMSIQNDKIILPYAKSRSNHPRQCIIIGTFNPEEGEGYLNDMTGNRRYWSVLVRNADIDGLRTLRDQIWAEAKHAYCLDELWWFEGEEEVHLAKEVASSRTTSEVWADILEDKILGIHQLRSMDIYNHLGLPTDRINRETQTRMGRAMRNLGYKYESRKVEGRSLRLWIKS